jgi:flagellar biosynthesis GTPase FlhF
MIPGEALIAATDGNSFESRSARARRQRRDRKGRFAYEGGGIRALIRRINGEIFSISGRVVANAKNSRDVEVEFPDGKIAEVNPVKGEYIKAVLPTPDGYSPEPIVPSVTEEVIDEKDLVFVDAPNGWVKDEDYKDFGDKVERYVDSNKEFVVFVSKQDDGTKDYQILNAKSAEQIDVVKTWADVQDRLEGKEDQLLNPQAKLPFRQGLIPAEDRPGPNAYERLMAEKKDKENAIANRKAELKKNADDRVDALDRTVPEGWDIEEKNNALMLRRATEPADLENVYKQDNFVARVVEQGEISVKDVNNLLEDKIYDSWGAVEKDKDARATEYAQKAREEIKNFAPAYGYKEEDLNKIDSMSADEIASFFLDEKLQPEGFADALDDYMNSAMVDAPSQQQQAKWKSFGEKLKVINDAGDFPGNNKKKADLPKQPDAPVEVKGGFEFNYPLGAYKIKQDSEYDVQGRVDEESTDFTDDPIELAQKQDERDILAALEQAVSPGEDGENALGVGALPFNKGDEFVPAEALFFALEEAGIDAPMELAKIYDKKLGADNNEKALNDFRKKAEIVSGNTPELAESFKKVTEQNPDLEPPTREPEFDARQMDLVPLPPLLEGLSQKELDEFNETKNHIPYLPKNEEIEMPEGYNPLSPEPFAAWKEVTAENPDPVLPEGFSDNPVFLAQEIATNDLLKELRRSVEPGNEVPGAAVIALPTDDGEDFVANVPGEAVRDALQLKGIDTNAELRKIVEEGLVGQVEDVADVDIPADDAVRLVVDGDVPLETQIRNAIAAKQKIAFLYNGTERLVLPVEVFENPRNSNVNVRAIDANGDRRTFTLSKIENSKEGSPVAVEITDKEIFDRRMAGESLQDLADALGIPREEVRAREAKYARENPEARPEAVVGDYKPTADQIDKIQKGVAEMDWLDEGIMFLKPDDGGPRAEAPIEIYDDNGLPEDGPFAKIDLDGNFEWKDQEAYDKYADRLKEIIDANLVGVGDNQADQEPQEIDNVPVEQEKLDDNQEPKDKTYVEENPEVIKVNAFVEANAGRLAPTKARDVKTGDFLWNNFNKVYEEILDIQPAAFGRVRFLIKDPRNQKEYFRFFDRRSPIRNMRRLGTGEVPEDFRVPSEENVGDGPKRGRALRQPLEQRVEVVAGRDVGGFAYREGFYKDKNGIVLKPGDRVRHGNPKKDEMYGEGVVIVRAGDQIDEAKKVGGIGRNGKVYKDYVWVQLPGEASPRLWKSRMIFKQGDSVDPARVAPVAPEVKVPDVALPTEADIQNQFNLLGSQYVRDNGVKVLLKVDDVKIGDFMMSRSGKVGRVIAIRDAGDGRKAITVEYRGRVEYEYRPYKKDARLDGVYRIPTQERPDPNAGVTPFAPSPTPNAQDPNEVIKAIVKLNPKFAAAKLAPEIKKLPYLKEVRSENEKNGIRYAKKAYNFLKAGDALNYEINAAKAKRRLEGRDRYASLIQKLDEITSSVQNQQPGQQNNLPKEPVKEFNGPELGVLDPIQVADERKNNNNNAVKLNKFWNDKVLSETFWDELKAEGLSLDQFKNEIRDFFADGQEKPLASLSFQGRVALNAVVSKVLLDRKYNDKGDIAKLAFALQQERLAYEPNPEDIGIGAALADLPSSKLEEIAPSRNSKAMLEFGGRRWFVLRLGGEQKGGGRYGKNKTWKLVDEKTGEVFFFKRDESKKSVDSEIAASAFLRAVGALGAYKPIRHKNEEDIVISNQAGKNLKLKEAPDQAHLVIGRNDMDFIQKGNIAQAVHMAMVDALIDNTDRHMNNFQGAKDDLQGVNNGQMNKYMLILIDQGLGRVYDNPNAAVSPKDFIMRGLGLSGIPKQIKRYIGTEAFYELLQISGQQALQALRREYAPGQAPEVDVLIQRLEEMLAHPIEEWR